MQEMKPIKEGKVREIYDNGDSLIMVATDRISCFDVILNNVVTKKGTVLTQMSKFWFNMTKDILPNHMISTDVKDMPLPGRFLFHEGDGDPGKGAWNPTGRGHEGRRGLPDADRR